MALIVAACSSDDGGGSSEAAETDPSGPTTSAAGDPGTDKLAQVQARGTIVLPIDPAYPPLSFIVEGAERSPDTGCAQTQLTGQEVDGYDVAVGNEVAEALGVEPCFVTPTWTEMIAGNWADRWDIAFASIGITADRMENLVFTQPYYATPERFYVLDDGPITGFEDLNGARIGVCTGCYADLYLQHELVIPGIEVTYAVDDAEIVGYNVERDGLDDVGAGKLDAFLCQETPAEQAIAEGIALRALDPPAYTAFIGGAIDRTSGLSLVSFNDRVNEILRGLHADGTLSELSLSYLGKDYATAAGAFDLDSIGQTVE